MLNIFMNTEIEQIMLKTNDCQISLQQIEDFEQDGVICLKGVLNDIWIERMRTAVERNILNSVGLLGSRKLKNTGLQYDFGLWLRETLHQIMSVCLISKDVGAAYTGKLVLANR